MVKVKICGLTRREEIAAINTLPVDYVGFVFAHSKREVSPAQAKELSSLVTYAKKVGVFVNMKVNDILSIVKECALDVIQLHGDEEDITIRYLQANCTCEVWKALRIGSKKDILRMRYYHPDRFLFDALHKDMYGGSGMSIEETLLQDIDLHNIILAGGINIHNAHHKLKLCPYGIDLSSGVETDGRKDFDKIQHLMKEVKSL